MPKLKKAGVLVRFDDISASDQERVQRYLISGAFRSTQECQYPNDRAVIVTRPVEDICWHTVTVHAAVAGVTGRDGPSKYALMRCVEQHARDSDHRVGDIELIFDAQERDGDMVLGRFEFEFGSETDQRYGLSCLQLRRLPNSLKFCL